MDLVEGLLLGTIVLIAISAIVFFIKRAKNSKKEKIEKENRKKTEEFREKKATQAKQSWLGMELTRALNKEAEDRNDQKYSVGYFPENGRNKEYFTIIIRNVQMNNVDCFQITISVNKNSIEIIDTDNTIKTYTLNQIQDVKKMLCEKIRALQ